METDGTAGIGQQIEHPTSDPQPPAADVATQDVAPSESAGTQTAAGSPSEEAAGAQAPAQDPTAAAETQEPADAAEVAAPEQQPAPVEQNVEGSTPVAAPAEEPLSAGPVDASSQSPLPDTPPAAPATDSAGSDGEQQLEAPAEEQDDYPEVPINSFCTVFRGEFAGRYGVFMSVATTHPDGSPDRVTVRTRDADDLLLVVNYSDIKPDVAGKR